jgi:hypothetical protein
LEDLHSLLEHGRHDHALLHLLAHSEFLTHADPSKEILFYKVVGIAPISLTSLEGESAHISCHLGKTLV